MEANENHHPDQPLGLASTEVLGPSPGPWHWVDGRLQTEDGESVLWPRNVPGGDDLQWSQQLGACGRDTEKRAAANAKLLESAPELLSELQAIIDQYNRDPATVRVRSARALVRRVLGA